MKHLIFLLYLLSYTAGIGAITLFVFFDIKHRQRSIRYLIYLDLFFTLTLIFDTIDYYRQIISPSQSEWFARFLIYGLLTGCIGVSYYLASLVYEATARAWGRRHRIIFSFISVLALLIIHLLFILDQKEVISDHVALRAGFSVGNLYIVAWFFYLAVLVIRKMNLFDETIRPMVKLVLAVSAILLPLSFLASLIPYSLRPQYPLAFSPLVYFILNTILIGGALKYFLREGQSKPPLVIPDPNAALTENLNYLMKEYKITEREMGIIRLIVEGYNNSEIGGKLFISPNTVKNHIYSIFKKLGVKSRFELINLLISYQKVQSGS